MNLIERLNLAGKGLLGILNANDEWLPTGGYEAAHDMGRWWDAALRLEETVGFVIPADLEVAALRNLQRLADNPDRLLMNREDIPCLKGQAKINPHNFRESLLAYVGLIKRRHSGWAREAAMDLVKIMGLALGADGSFDFSMLGTWGQLSFTNDPSHTEEKHDGWFDGTATSGRALEALVCLYDATGESAVLDVARRIAEHHFVATVNQDGTPRKELFNPENVGHDHSYQGTLRGLLLFGLRTGQTKYVDTVEASYRKTVRNEIVKESGWAPHCLGKVRFVNEHGDAVSDPASAGDAAQLALWLALHVGCDDLLDDVERLVRSRLMPAQLTEADMSDHLGHTFEPRDVGAWCIHDASHAGKGCTPDVHAAVIHTLCDIQSHVLTCTDDVTRINLHFDAENDHVSTTSSRNKEARLCVYVKQPGNLMIRIPSWASQASVKFVLDGLNLPLQQIGHFAKIPGKIMKVGSELVLTHDLPQRRSVEQMRSGRHYTFSWSGDEITGIEPQDGPMPFYSQLTHVAY